MDCRLDSEGSRHLLASMGLAAANLGPETSDFHQASHLGKMEILDCKRERHQVVLLELAKKRRDLEKCLLLLAKLLDSLEFDGKASGLRED